MEAALATKSASSPQRTKDGEYLLDLLCDIPIRIPIGPYAARKGVKANSIIKRLAGIKARNGLQISTTMGNAESSPLLNGNVKVKMKKETIKKQRLDDISFSTEEQSDVKGEPVLYGMDSKTGLTPYIDNGLQTPATSPSGPSSFSYSFTSQTGYPSWEQSTPATFPLSPTSSFPKRSFEQVTDLTTEDSDVDGRAWKKVKTECAEFSHC